MLRWIPRLGVLEKITLAVLLCMSGLLIYAVLR